MPAAGSSALTKRQPALSGNFCIAHCATATYAVYFPFAISAASENASVVYPKATGYWENFVDSLLEFFATGVSPIPKEQTLCIAELLEKAVAKLEKSAI